ncbi:hypothetical protein F4861DRAFT_503974 [Xylaria intraflava]|nr:hypothetical protein F4861DRAFT_503974 [Xylaria intraflava]
MPIILGLRIYSLFASFCLPFFSLQNGKIGRLSTTHLVRSSLRTVRPTVPLQDMTNSAQILGRHGEELSLHNGADVMSTNCWYSIVTLFGEGRLRGLSLFSSTVL